MSNIKNWKSVAAENEAIVPPEGLPTGSNPRDVDNVIRHQMAAHRQQWENAQFFDYGHEPTFVSANSFRVDGDFSDLYEVRRRLCIDNDGDIFYATITNVVVSSSPATTVELNIDGDDVLTNDLNSIAPSIISVSNGGLPSFANADRFIIRGDVNTNQTTSGLVHTILYDKMIDSQNLGYLNGGNGRFTAPFDCILRIDATIAVTNITGTQQDDSVVLRPYKDGVGTDQGVLINPRWILDGTGQTELEQSMNAVFELEAGEEVDIRMDNLNVDGGYRVVAGGAIFDGFPI